MTRLIHVFVFGGILPIASVTGVASPTTRAIEDARECSPADGSNEAPPRDEMTENGQTLRSPVEGETTIVRLLPEGTTVKTGDVVCELDAADLRDQLTKQHMAAENAQADYVEAKKFLKFAEWDVAYIKELYPSELRRLHIAFKLARSNLNKAKYQDQLIKARHEEKRASRLDVLEAEIEVVSAELALKRAEKAKYELIHETYDRQVKALKYDVRIARDELEAKEAILERQRKKEQELERMIEHCKMRAPIDGVVRRLENVKAGSLVRKGQPIIKIVPQP